MNGEPRTDGRSGRPFTLRLTENDEYELRGKLAALAALPRSEQPSDLFGYGGNRRAGSFGWFVVWAALEYSRGKTSELAPWDRPPPKPAKRAGRAKAKKAKRGRK